MHFKGTNSIKDNTKHNNFEYVGQIFLMETRKLKLIKIQVSVSIIYVKIFTQSKKITRNEKILANFFQ